MEKIDTIIFGDNQFFGINNRSQRKARQLGEKFRNLKSIIQTYDYAIANGINAFMLNTNEKSGGICKYFQEHKTQYSNINWYPSLPYPHKYSMLVAERGIVQAINELVFQGNSAKGLLNLFAKGGSALFTQKAKKIMQILVATEMKSFRGLNVKTVFLQDTITDLLLGLQSKAFFIEYSAFIKRKYKVPPGFLTLNLPALVKSFEQWGIEEVVICSSINKLGFRMSPDLQSYEEILRNIDKDKYTIMAMSVLASGAINPEEAISYISTQNVDSVVFGASTYDNIMETKGLLDKYFAASKNLLPVE